MKVFNYTDGVKGELLGQSSLPIAASGWLVRKGDNVYKVELANTPSRDDVQWAWQSATQIKDFSDEGKFLGERDLTPEEFGVEAICFCTGEIKMGTGNYWDWNVIGTAAWNKEACQKGILKATFTHTNTVEDRSLMCAKDANVLADPDVAAMVERFEADLDLVKKYMEEGVTHDY